MSDLLGKMKAVVLFRANTPASQGAGGTDSYSDLLTTRGYLRKSSGSRGLNFGEIAGNDSWKLTVRYRAALWNAVRIDMKAVINSKTYKLAALPTKVEEQNSYIEFSLNEQEV